MGEWKPGTVIGYPRGESSGALLVVDSRGLANGYDSEGYEYTRRNLGTDPDLRPLVVIDPEDPEQVERLRISLKANYGDGEDFGVAAALREFADPTPPTCRASLNVRLLSGFVAASCGEPMGHEGSHRSDNGTSWDAKEADNE